MVTYSAGSASIAIRPDLRNFRRRVVAGLKNINVEHSVQLEPDFDRFQQKVEGYLSSVNSELDVNVALKTAGANAALERLTRDRDIHVDVDVNTAAAQTQVAALNTQLGHTEMRLGRIALMGSAISVLGVAGSGALPSITALAGGLVNVSGSLVTLPAMAGAAGASLGGLALGSMGLVDAFSAMSGEAEEFEEALADLSPTAAETVRAVRDVKDEWSDMQTTVQDSLFEGLGYSVERFTSQQLPTLETGLSSLNHEFNRGFRASVEQFSSEAAVLDFERFLDNSARGMSGLALASAPLSQIWIDLATVGSEYLPGMARSIGATTTRWSEMLSEARRTGELNEFIEDGIDSLGRLGSGIGQVGGIIVGTVRAANEVGNPMLDTIYEGLAKTHAWIDSVDGNTALVDYFQTTATATGDLLDVLGPVANILVTDFIPGVAGLISGAAPGTIQFFASLRDHADGLAPAMTSVGEGASDLVGALAPAGPVLSATIDLLGDAGNVLSVVATPLEVVSGLLGDHPGLVLAGAAAWGAWKFAPPVVEKLSGALSFAGGAAKEVGLVGSSIVGAYRAAREGAPEMSRFGAGMHVLAGEGGLAAAAFDGVKKAGGGLIDFFGGPWAVGLMAATAVAGAVIDGANRASEAEERLAGQAHATAEAHYALTAAVAGTTGELGEDGLAAAADLAMAELTELTAIGERMDGLFSTTGINPWTFEGTRAEMQEAQAEVYAMRDAYEELESVAGEMGYSIDDVYGIIAAGGPEFDSLVSSLRDTGETGELAADQLLEARKAIDDAVDAARRLDPGAREAAEAVGVLADEASSASEKLGALETIMQNLGMAPKDADRAMREAASAVSELSEKVITLADDSGDFGDALFDLSGALKLDGNADVLWDQLDELRDQLWRVAVNGGDTAGTFENMRPVLQQLQDEFQLTDEQIAEVSRSMGLVPEMVEALVQLEGAETAEEELAAILLALTTVGEGETIEVETLSDAARKDLEDLGIRVQELPDGNIRITDNAKTTAENVRAQLDNLTTRGTHYQTWIRQVQDAEYANSAGGSQPVAGAMQAEGSVRAHGSVATQPAQVRRGGEWVVYAEDETGGESFIPHAPEKRGRSTQILAETAGIFGLQLVDANGNYVRRDGSTVDWNGRTSYFADGAVRTAREIDEFARGLEGAPYVWGGVNWGDCSGAMSAIARFATGLEPFAGRFATMNQYEALMGMGFSPGLGAPGDLAFGWFNGGQWGGHTSGTLPNGVNVEMGGARGNGQYGGNAAPASHPQYTHHAHKKVPGGASGGSDYDDYLDYGPSGRTSRSTSITGMQVAAPISQQSDTPTSISDVAAIGAAAFAKGMTEDALGVFGIPDSPPALQAWGAWQDATAAPAGQRTMNYVDDEEVKSLERDIANTEEELRIERMKIREMDEKTSASTRAAADLRLKKKQQDLDDTRRELDAARAGQLYEIRDDGTLGSKVDEQVAMSDYEMQQRLLANAENDLLEAVVGRRPHFGTLPDAVSDPLKMLAKRIDAPLRFAMGGTVPFIGGPVADMVPALLSAGEHVTNSVVAAQARPLLTAMNNDPNLARTLNEAVFSQPKSAGNTTIEYHIHAANADEGIRRAEMMERRRLASMNI
ncbi:hypothetical protein AALI21_02730 [Corynebacteriaceae bacterium 6-324]